MHLWSVPDSSTLRRVAKLAQVVVRDRRAAPPGARGEGKSLAVVEAVIAPSETLSVVESVPGRFEAGVPYGVPENEPHSRENARARLGVSRGATIVGIVLSGSRGPGSALTVALELCQNCSPQQDTLFLPLGSPAAKRRFRAAAKEAKIESRVLPTEEIGDSELLGTTDILWVSGGDGVSRAYANWAAAEAIPVVGPEEERPARAIDTLVADPRRRKELALQEQTTRSATSRIAAATEMLEALYARLLAEAGLPAPVAPNGPTATRLGSTDSPEPGVADRESPLRIAMVTQEDPFYIPLFFREFLRIAGVRRELPAVRGSGAPAGPQAPAAEIPTSGRPVEVRGLMIQRPLGNKTSKGLAKRIWRLYGTLGFLRMGFRYLGAKVAGRLLPGRSVAGAAEAAGVPLLPMTDANGEAFLSFVRDNQIDLVVSVSASQIFKGEILSAPTYGCINLHNAPLPHYRGMLPNFWQIYHGEKESVLTIHQMVEDLDKGDILLQRATPISDGMSLEELIRLTKIRSARALWHLLDRFATGNVEVTPLPEEKGSYFTWPSREEAREFRRRGRKLL